MFDIFKKDIKVGDKVKLYLTTGKEPEGVVAEIGESYALLKSDDGSFNKFFDKLIGGWDLMKIPENGERSELSQSSSTLENEKTNKVFLLNCVAQLTESLDKTVLEQQIPANATIFQVSGLICKALMGNKEISIPRNVIMGEKLALNIAEFKPGFKVQVVVSCFQPNGPTPKINAASLPNKIGNYLRYLTNLFETENYPQASLLLHILKLRVKSNVHLGNIINEVKKPVYKRGNAVKTIESQEEVITKNNFLKKIEKEINGLIQNSQYDDALAKINDALNAQGLDNKYQSSLLLKKAQIYSSLNNPDASEKAYQELVLFNEKINAPLNNLSHLYTEISRLQAQNINKQTLALESVKKALRLNPNNNFALSLLKQFEEKSNRQYADGQPKSNLDEHLLIESDDDATAISKMIDIDIREHKYTHPEIIRNGGQPTAFIAKMILDEAKQTREVDLSERYPIYLEAAKAFSELNVGSYDLQDYLESVAYYSMLKGNSIFINFRNKVLNGDLDLLRLTRLKDSSCSYYLESMNLMSNIEPKLLLGILTNFLKLNLVAYYIERNSAIDFKPLFRDQFADVFSNCLTSKNRDIEIIAYNTILSCGVSSIHAWNKLATLPKGTGRLYREFYVESNRKRIFKLINEQESGDVDINLTPSEFLKRTFQNRRAKAISFNDAISHLLSIEMEPHSFSAINSQWNKLSTFESLLSYTDKEIKSSIDGILSILQPYLNRSQAERTNILIQASTNIERQIKFINENTTFHGRIYYYALLNKWKREIDTLLAEKIEQSYPFLTVTIDPPYYIQLNGNFYVPIIIKNIGVATSEGFSMSIKCESTEYEKSVTIPYESDAEIAAGSKVEASFEIPKQMLVDSTAVELSIDIQSVYQKKKLLVKNYQFTVEEEPQAYLSYEEIPWRDSTIPPEQLFKGRRDLIASLSKHYLSIEKDKPYILYGLTRTGKSSILEYLRKNLEGKEFLRKGAAMQILTFSWDLSVAASYKKAADFWEYLLSKQTVEEIERYSLIYGFDVRGLNIRENAKAKDFRAILDFLKERQLFPMFFVDEFSFVKTLIDDGTINSAFLHTLRQFSLNELASFIFAGTYDIKGLIKNPQYGITGQLVNAIEEQVSEISPDAAEELIDVICEKLSFTPEAIEHIKFLSGRVPYFIQIICKNCGYYAVENKRRYIGYPELERVVRILTGKEQAVPMSLVKKLPENVFQNNQFSPADPKEVAVLISSIVNFNKDRIENPRGVGFAELQKLWADRKISAFRPRLAEAINLLKEKRILIQEEDEEIPVYKLSVDLFRRWWEIHNPDLSLALTTLIEE